MVKISLKKIQTIIKKYREVNIITQKKLAYMTGYGLNTVKKYETSKSNISSTFLYTFLEKCKVSKVEKKIILDYIETTSKKKNKTTDGKLKTFENYCFNSELKNDMIKTLSKILQEEMSTFTSDISKINSEIKEKKELNKELETAHKRLIDINDKINSGDSVRAKAFKNDFSNTSLVINRMWKLNNEVNKIFGELELLLDINNVEENLKMKKGLETIGNNLITKGQKILSYVDTSNGEIIEID